MGGPLSPLWSADSIAVVGASDRPGALGRLPVQFLKRYGYQGRILPVNPRGGEILGLPVHPSVTAAPGPVDLALVLVAADRVAAAIDDCATAGVPVVIVGSSGFAEAGPDGAVLQTGIAARAEAAGIRLLGPNCIGSVNFHTGLVASFSPMFAGIDTRLVPGRIGFVSQSGALGYGTVSLAFERGLGLGWTVTTGNEADITALETLLALADEPECTALLGYLEALTDIDRLRQLAAAGKPVALLKTGRTEAGARAAASHTGALATEDRVVDATLWQLGIVRVSDVDELLDVGDAFESPYRPDGPRVAVVTTSGGSGILAADAIAAHGLVLGRLAYPTREALRGIVPAYGAVENPVDVTASVMRDPTLVERALRVVADDAQVDMLVVGFCVLTGADAAPVVAALGRVAAQTGKPVLVARTGADHLAPDAAVRLRAAGVPVYQTPARAVRAAAALWQVSRTRHRPPVRVTPLPGGAVPEPGVTEAGLKRLLAGAGIVVPRGTAVSSPEAATRAVHELGGLAVLKAQGLLHKTEEGGVVLGVTPELAAETYIQLADLVPGEAPVLVEEQLPAGVEVLVGIAPSPLGAVLTLGAGGVLTEVLEDVAVRLLPVDEFDIRDMLSEIRVSRLLAGHRGTPPADLTALTTLICRLQELTATWPDGFSLDLNPVVALPDRAVALDAAYLPPGVTPDLASEPEE